MIHSHITFLINYDLSIIFFITFFFSKLLNPSIYWGNLILDPGNCTHRFMLPLYIGGNHMVFIVKIAYAIVITDFQLDGFPKSYLFNFVNS